MKEHIDIQGHRGCRGLMPENTIPGFLKAVDLGVHTLEMDVVVNQFGDVIVSHEPFFNHEISIGPNQEKIKAKNELEHNMYPLSLEDIQLYDVGSKPHPRFKKQKKLKAFKPSLEQVVEAVNGHLGKNGLEPVNYNIEIKRGPKYDQIFHPTLEVFAETVCKEIIRLGISPNTTIQSFDLETLRYVHEHYPSFVLVLLIENRNSFEQNIENLGFKPGIYSPNFSLVTHNLVVKCANAGIKLIPWTVNVETDIQHMIDVGVDGIISDFPDRVVRMVNKAKLEN